MQYFLIKWKLIPNEGKPTTHQMLIQETGITEAEAAFKKYMHDTLQSIIADFEIISISKSKISEVVINTTSYIE